MARKTKSSTPKRRTSKRNSKSPPLLQNKLMLYLSLIIFIFNVLAFMFYQDMQSLFLFVANSKINFS